MKNLDEKAIVLLNMINDYKSKESLIVTVNFINELKDNDIPCRYRILNELLKRDIICRIGRGYYKVCKEDIILLRQIKSALYDARAYFCNRMAINKSKNRFVNGVISNEVVNSNRNYPTVNNRKVAIDTRDNIIVADVLKLTTLKPGDECLVIDSNEEIKLLRVFKVIKK